MIEAQSSDGASLLDPALRARVLERHRSQALDLVASALRAWGDTGYVRFNDREVSCTVRVFDAMLTILREREPTELVQIFPQIEGVEVTADHLQGKADFAKAKRADLVLYLGGNHSNRICVECKRLHRGANGAEYVDNGVMRFVAGSYVGDQGRAVMVGYVMSRTVPERVVEINRAVDSHTALGSSHRLTPSRDEEPVLNVHRSDHEPPGLQLTHMFVDMRDRGPAVSSVEPADV